MNKEAAGDFSTIIRTLSEHLLSKRFETMLLHSLSSFFEPCRIAFVSRKKHDRADGIWVAESSAGTDREEMMPDADFTARYGFSIFDAEVAETSLVKSLSTDGERVVISFLTRGYHSIILMTDVKNTIYLLDEQLTLMNSLIELLLNARYAIKEVIKTEEMDVEKVTGSSHRIQGALSSILTAVEMLSAEDLPDDDRNQLKKLAYNVIDELKAVIDAGFAESRSKSETHNSP